ncbi:MAG: helix-turn-helix transcriptional regulator [Treponema sp.]|jgi:transcriptional regulator with XRE-family HTH domain|nr:helix-turn-helix transcriptional regulator [Treponema sp.]
MSFWENVEILRKEQNTTYRWIASKMGVSETTVSSMRKANTEPRASQAVKIAEALDTTVEFLVTNKEAVYLYKYNRLKSEMLSIIEKY